jgi:hypothetical protein
MSNQKISLESQKFLLQMIIDKDKKLQSELSKRINANLIKLKELDNVANPKRIEISDHFIIRYLERVEQIPVNELRDKLIANYRDVIMSHFGNCKIQHNKYLLIIRDYTFITIHNIRKDGSQFKL